MLVYFIEKENKSPVDFTRIIKMLRLPDINYIYNT